MKSPERGVEIWQAHLDSASVAEIEDLRRLLDRGEKERAEKFYRERDGARFIVAHGLLRLLLSDALERSTIAFTYGVNGKPALAQDDDFHFNLSHSADWAVFALSRKRRVGIDLESAESLVRNPNDLPAMAQRIFSKRELADWRALPDEKIQIGDFLRLWTRKEACLKAAGLRLDDMMAIDTGFSIAKGPQVIVIPLFRDEAPLQLIIHDLPIPLRPASAATACALAIETSCNS